MNRMSHTVGGQNLCGLAILGQSVRGRRCRHHALLRVHLTPLRGRARRSEKEYGVLLVISLLFGDISDVIL